MANLHMGVYAGIAAGGVMVMLVLIPILGCLFSRNKKAKKALLEDSVAEKGEIVYSAPVPASTQAPSRPANAVLQKSNMRQQPSVQSMSPSYRSQASTIAPQSQLRNMTPSPPHIQPLWVKPSP